MEYTMDNTILLVDDEAGIRKVLGISLQDSGYDVHSAEKAAGSTIRIKLPFH